MSEEAKVPDVQVYNEMFENPLHVEANIPEDRYPRFISPKNMDRAKQMGYEVAKASELGYKGIASEGDQIKRNELTLCLHSRAWKEARDNAKMRKAAGNLEAESRKFDDQVNNIESNPRDYCSPDPEMGRRLKALGQKRDPEREAWERKRRER